MISLINFFKRPEYLFRPQQVLRRFQRPKFKDYPESVTITLPWGANVIAHTYENIGLELYHYGIFDKIVPEAIARLLDEGELALDIGANIGQNCSFMTFQTGSKGRVIAFEPHPEIFGELKANARSWTEFNTGQLQLEQVALAEKAGEGTLSDGDEFSHNRGSAALTEKPSASGVCKVRIATLDSYLMGSPQVGVCKIDVEGHELGVLQGATETLKRKGIRDIIFEDFQSQPSAVTQLLQQHGFKVFELHEGWLKPRIETLRDGKEVRPGFSFNFVATLDSDRALARFRRPGWRCL